MSDLWTPRCARWSPIHENMLKVILYAYTRCFYMVLLTTVLVFTILSYQSCATLDTDYKFKTNFWGKPSWYLFKQYLIYNLVANAYVHSAKHETFLPTSYTCAWKLCPGLITPPLPAQHASKIQMISHCYKTRIVRHLTHSFSAH